MWPQPNRVHFFRALVVNVGAEKLFGEDVAFEEEGVVFFQGIQGIFERAWHGGNFCKLLWTEIVDVLVKRLAGINLAFDTIQTCHEHGSERQVWIAARVWRTELYALGFR